MFRNLALYSMVGGRKSVMWGGFFGMVPGKGMEKAITTKDTKVHEGKSTAGAALTSNCALMVFSSAF
jgi:hypothetical protein